MTRSNPFVLLALAVAAGIWLAATFPMPVALPAVAFAVGALATLGAVWLRSAPSNIWPVACAALVCFGALRYTLDAPLPAARSVARYNGQQVILEGLVVDEPDERPTHTNLRLRPLRIHTAQMTDASLDDLVLVRVAAQVGQARWRYGDVVRVEGLLDAPPRMSSFDYREYLARRGVFSWVKEPRVLTRVRYAPESPFYAQLLLFKDAIRQGVKQASPASEAALLNGVLLGDGQAMPWTLKEAFRRTGTSHLVAISGSNFSILIALVLPLMIRMVGRRQAALLAIPAIALYAVFVGLEASVMRAAVMAGVGLIGMLLWRRGITLNTLCAAAFILMVVDPHILFDAGFQLSFSATLGLVLYAERLSARLRAWTSAHIPQPYAQRGFLLFADVASMTLVTHLTTLPVMWLIFEAFSSVALLTNMIVVPLQVPIMVTGVPGALIAAFAPQGVSELALWLARLPLRATIWVIQLFAGVEGALVAVPFFSLPAAGAYYTALFVLTAFLLQPAQVQRAVIRLLSAQRVALSIGITGLTALGLGLLFWFQQPDGRLHLILVGSSAVIHSPTGEQAVFLGDGDVVRVLRRTMPVGDGLLEAVILPERSEHSWENTRYLLAHYRARHLILPPGHDSLSTSVQALRSSVETIVTATDGFVLALGDQAAFTVVPRMPSGDGRQAIGVRLSHGEVLIDLVGDQEAIDYLQRSTLTFLHPARASVSALSAASPRWVVWTDGPAGRPPLLGAPIRALNLKEVAEAVFVSDGRRLTLR